AGGALVRESGAQIACRWGWGGDFCTICPHRAYWMYLLIMQHLSGYIYAAKHRYWLCYILLYLIMIIQILPTQSNDEATKVLL
ncbi:hypothetical protein, partial [uncultured Subdoligranulum sp.]|uniref:hypothetical protein n=1 Tax=uncultured Subdoligranulum sp. TaxID=512298 RepID=UPI0025EE9364